MSVDSKTRVVPSGQIYRQMFDAQLQLNRSLSRYDSESRIQRLKSRELSQSQSLPLIRLDKEDTRHGLLTSRQKTWVGGFPNDPYTENPVLYKQYSEYMNQKLQISEGSHAGREVRGLPDVVVPAKQGSDIVERIAESRRQRHESAVEDMHQELSMISTEMEPLIEDLSAKLLNKLAVDDEEISAILSRIEEDEKLLQYQLPDLFGLWEEVQSHTPHRQNLIQDMDVNLKKVEADRMEKIREVFTRFGEKFHKISHLMQPDLQRFMDKESQMINQTMLSNRRSYADLFVRLISADVEREKTQRTVWRRRVENWKALNTKLSIESFKDFMQTENVVQPPGVENVKNILLSDQEVLNSQRLQLVETLCDMKPPNFTKSAVYKWRQDMKKLTEELDSITQVHMSKLHEEYEKVCQMCLEKVDNVKLSLIEAGICSSHRANQVVDEFMLPLVGEQQRIFEHNLEAMEKVTEQHNAKMEEEITALFKFSQGAAHVWDVHEIGLAKQERALQEKLEECRQKHDQANQEKEANLDIVMDRMRQDATEMALKDSLIKALTMLEKIRESYEEFHGQQTEIVQTYPDMVQGELNTYDKAVCRFFTVTRQAVRPTDLGEDKVEADEMEGEEKREGDLEAGSELKVKRKVSTKKSTEWLDMMNKALNMIEMGITEKRKPETDHPPYDVAEIVKEVLRTTKGTEFYVLREAEAETEDAEAGQPEEKGEGEEEAENLAFFTEVEGQEESGRLGEKEMEEFIQKIDIPHSLIVEVKQAIRLNFLEHMDDWCEQAIERASSVVVAKCEELNSELDLRLHLHRPRPRRAELDVHNVRAAELVMHAERVTRHCSGMEQSLAELGQRFKAMSHQHNKLANKFRADIEALEVIFVNATKSARLVKLQNQVSVELDKFMSVIRTSLRQFRQHLDETLQMLRESNARFIKSFKVFSDGGNFCPEEIEDYRKKLEKMSSMIDSTEGSIMSDLEGMESKRLDSATKIAVEFEDRFKSHMNDLIFMERVARWLTNTQVKIKAEVANSNTQAQRLVQLLNDLERRIDACEKPNLDKEQITAAQLNETLFGVFEAFVSRSEYLNCGKPSAANTAAPSGAPTTAKVGFTAETAGGKTTKGAEDPSVGVIKSILNKPSSAGKDRTQRSKMRFGSDAELDGDTAAADSAREKTKSAMSQASSKVSEASKGTRKGTTAMAETMPRRTQSGSRRTSKPAKFDKKYMVFGEKGEEGTDGDADEKHFLSVIQRSLREALDGLLTTSEVFYRQKGTRPVTRPQALQETFEQCADIISQKMQSYYHQADEYHNQCLQEFRKQLVRLEQLCAHVPGLVIADLLKDEVQQLQDAQSNLTMRFQSTLDQLAGRRTSNQNELRPTLGHPHHSNDLAALCSVEAERHQEYLEAVAKITLERQECAVEQSKAFLDRLVKTGELQLQQYDGLLVVDDVDKGRVEPKRYPTSELIRRKNAGEPLEDEEDKDALPRGKANWIGVPSNQFTVEGRPSKLQVTPTVATRKTTLAHSATVKARDKTYEDYKEQFERTLQDIEMEKEKLILSENRWEESWENSIDKVKSLYQIDA